MEGQITSFRRSIKKTSQRHMIISLEGVSTRDAADKLVGKKIIYNTGTKDLVGKIAAPHGKKGAIRAIFETGMPGQSVGKKVSVS